MFTGSAKELTPISAAGKIVNVFSIQRTKNPEKTRLGHGESLIIFWTLFTDSDVGASHTILKKAPFGALSERAWTHLVHHAHLRLIDLYPLHQRPNHLSSCSPVGLFQTLIHPLGEPLQLTDDQAKLLLRRLSFSLDPRLRLQLRQPFPRPKDPRFELGLLHQTVLVRVDQPGDPPLGGLDHLTEGFASRPVP